MTDELEYPFDIDSADDIEQKTQELTEFWYNRWLLKRLTTVDIIEPLERFDVDPILVSATR